VGIVLPEGSVADHPGRVLTSHDAAVQHLLSLQRADGSWEGEVVWCTMILSQYTIACRVVGRAFSEDERRGIVRHYEVTRTPQGGWGLHPEDDAQVFTTALAYVALRILGVAASDDLAAPAREWLRRQPGGVLAIPTWGKFWLSIVGLYGTDGVGALPPELFTLPESVPVHPHRWYCHTRYIYLGMSYLSGSRFAASLGPLGAQLRTELYSEPYDTIDFAAQRRPLQRAVDTFSRFSSPARRRKALDSCFASILYEQRSTRYQGLSPVNGLLNCLAIFAADPQHPDLAPSLDGLEAWRWRDGEEGVRYAGARSQTWDTAFAARAVGRPFMGRRDRHDALHRAHEYLLKAQMTEDLDGHEREHRESILGGWCFSDGRHRWPVSDCSAEALAAIVEIEKLPGVVARDSRIGEARIEQAVRFILARQNDDGGFGTYERTRGAKWLERLNPSEMFRDCMIEHSYVECTASCVEALAIVRGEYPQLLTADVAGAVANGIAFLRRRQLPDGTFPAAWGIYFTYSIFHVTKALIAAGVDRGDPALMRAAAWLKSVQRADGGWGEHFSSCLTGRYVAHEHAQAVITAWAVLALQEIEPESDAVARGRRALESMQQPDGSWPHEAVNGVFFGTAMLDYRLYRAYFPAWALGH
jgi:squalene/oxidosqualene cyclase-like protein